MLNIDDKGEILEDLTLYCRLVGSLIYLTITRPDISFVVHTLSKFIQSPRHFHFSLLDISFAPPTVAYFSVLVLHSNSKHIVMLVGLVLDTRNVLLVCVYF